MKRLWACALCAMALVIAPAQAAPDKASDLPKSRVIVLTDIGSDPDDMESMVRFLLYANDFDIEALIPSTSRHLKDSVHPEQIVRRIDAYAQILPNLKVHANGWPSAETLRAAVKPGRPEYGMAGVGAGKDTPGSQAIIAAVDRPDPRPVWITIWGGAVDLAQALWHVRETRSPADLAKFVAKLRVYSISDQDNAGPWVRRYFPDLFWIVSLTAHRHYNLSTWGGISGDRMYYFDGPDFTTVSKEWLRENIQIGPLGSLYPNYEFIMEGDTPSFLYLVPNGLGHPEHPDYGSWGGRYGKISEWDGIWTDTSDLVTGADGRTHQSNKATIWRWRDAFQNDFAARIQWSLQSSYKGANHPPRLVLNGVSGNAPVELTAKAGDIVRLSAAGSTDPDGDAVTYDWWQYRESEATNRNPRVELQRGDPGDTRFTVPAVEELTRFHIILEARDQGKPALTAYRRAIITVTP